MSSTTLRRVLLLVPSAAFAAAIVALAVAVVGRGERPFLDWILLALFSAVMAWECFVVWQLCLGFATWLRGRAGLSALELRVRDLAPIATGRSRTALVIPIFDEDARAVFAAVDVMRRSLARLGPTGDLEVHVLSDTRDAATAIAEEAEFAAVPDRDGGPAGPAVRYRRRAENEGRKAGNVAEFLDRTAGRFDFAVVLDADSLMSGATVRRLIRLMEEHERVALIQTISYAAGRSTLFARIQQFAVRLYAPLALRGMEFWQGPDGSYWGHNAILRCAPFREHARLPILPGRPPLGGEILCHDVVEAAFLRRAGWEVRLLPDIEGTWEEMPTNVVDLMGRERRWCQGNLQHAGVLPMPGLTAGSRGHIALGIGGYMTAPLWWCFVLLGAVRVLAYGTGPDLGVLAYGLTAAGPAALGLAVAAALLILLPRVLNLWRALADGRERAEYGGGRRLIASAAIEQAFWILLGPTLSLVNCWFVLTTLAGRVVAWDSQPRADRLVTWAEALRVFRVPVATGLLLLVAAVAAGGWYAAWMAPTVAGLLAGPALAVWSSRVDLGEMSRRAGLFLTVDDTRPAREFLELRHPPAAPDAAHGPRLLPEALPETA